MLYFNITVQMDESGSLLPPFLLLLLSQNRIRVNFSSVTSCLEVTCTFLSDINYYTSFKFQFLQKFMCFNHSQSPFSQRSVLSCFLLFCFTLYMLHILYIALNYHYCRSNNRLQIIPKPNEQRFVLKMFFRIRFSLKRIPCWHHDIMFFCFRWWHPSPSLRNQALQRDITRF